MTEPVHCDRTDEHHHHLDSYSGPPDPVMCPLVVPCPAEPTYPHPSLNRLAALEEGWDGYVGLPPTKEALNSAARFDWFPDPSGGLEMVVHTGGRDIYIEILPDGKIGVVEEAVAGVPDEH